MNSPPLSVMTDEDPQREDSPSPKSTEKRRPGRPPTYVFSKPDSQLSENERRLKGAVIKRRLRQNRSYHRKKRLKELAHQAVKSAAAAAGPSTDNSVNLPSASFVTSNLPPVNLPSTSPPIASHGFTQPPPPFPLPVLAPLPALSSSSAMYSTPSIPTSAVDSSLHYLPPVRRDEPPRTHITVTSAATSPGAGEIPVSSPVLSSSLDLTPSPDHEINPSYFGTNSRLDGTLVQAPTSNVEVRVESSSGVPFLSIGAPRQSAKPQKGSATVSDGDEAQLLEEILDASNQRGPGSLVSIMPRGGNVRSFISQDMDIRLSSLPKPAVDGLKHLVLFPASFSAESALDVMGLRPDDSSATEVFKPLVELKLLRVLPSGRYELNGITKSLVPSDSMSSAREARQRFVNHFVSRLRSMDPDTLSRKGELRLRAMKQYDLERKNIQAALQMCRDIGGKKQTVDFLTHAAPVMRYSMPACERFETIDQVLNELKMDTQPQLSEDKSEARLLLSLSEACFDFLAFEKGEEHLRSAINMMADNKRGSFPVSSSVLTLLLLAELRISNHEYDDGKKVLAEALKSLNEAELQKSTFAVCCLLNLASVYLALRQFENALQTVNKGLDVLTELGFSEMPIYADALRTLGAVYFERGDTEQAQALFFSALNTIQNWMNRKDWESVPFQHCTHLDIFLVESIATTYIGQDKHQEAAQLFERARQRRQERRLDVVEAIQLGGAKSSGKLYTRHLY